MPVIESAQPEQQENIPILLPKSSRQIYNFFRIKQRLGNNNEETNSQKEESVRLQGMAKITVRAIYVLLADEVDASNFLDSLPHIKLLNKVMVYLMALNDQCDLEHLQSKKVENKFKKARKELMDSIQELPNETDQPLLNRAEVFQLIDQAEKEIETTEKWLKQKTRNQTLNLSDIEMYRNLINAINTVLGVSLVIGTSDLPQTQQVPTRDIDGVIEKYKWILNSHFSNKVQKAIIIMHLMSMAAQIDDDWYGWQVDKALHLDSFTRVALEETQQDRRQAKQLLDNIKTDYIKKAKKLGLGKVPIRVFSLGHKSIQKLMATTVSFERYGNPKTKEIVSKVTSLFGVKKVIDKFGIREIMYGKGEI